MKKFVVIKFSVQHDNDAFYWIGGQYVQGVVGISDTEEEAKEIALRHAPLYPHEDEGKKALDGQWTRILPFGD